MKWLAASANHGNVAAMVNLGYMSVNNSTDLGAGYCWLMRAALLDQPQAQEKLTSIFSDGAKDDHGTVIDADIVQADMWFRIVARSPYHDNSQNRAAIEPKMTTEQLNQAKRLFDFVASAHHAGCEDAHDHSAAASAWRLSADG